MRVLDGGLVDHVALDENPTGSILCHVAQKPATATLRRSDLGTNALYISGSLPELRHCKGTGKNDMNFVGGCTAKTFSPPGRDETPC
jgi:hypothetical protein